MSFGFIDRVALGLLVFAQSTITEGIVSDLTFWMGTLILAGQALLVLYALFLWFSKEPTNPYEKYINQDNEEE